MIFILLTLMACRSVKPGYNRLNGQYYNKQLAPRGEHEKKQIKE